MAVVTLDHLKSLALQAKSEIAEVASAAADALEEMDAQQTTLSRESLPTPPATCPASEHPFPPKHPQYYDFTAAGVTAADDVRVFLDPASVSAAVACGLCPTVETQDGKLRFRALQVPASAISVKYRIQEGKE